MPAKKEELDTRPDVVPEGAEPIELDVGRGNTLRGRAWGPEDGERWLVLHGWLDNCASMDYLCPLMNGANRLVCLDVAGHGHSDHRRGGSYTTADHVHDARMAALRLGWDRFSLMGHSMGGGICACLAGTIPDKIKRLVLLEITGQGGMSPTRAPQQLGRSLHLLSVRHGLAKRSGAGGGRGAGAKKDGKEAAGIWPQFQDAAAAAKQLSTASGKEQLQMYGLYKQAQAGPCDIPEPSDPKGKFKYKAWKAHGEMPREEAAAKVRALPSRCERAFASVR